VQEALRIFTMISISLYYVNSKGIIHRDLKPDNILMDKLGNLTLYKLSDFAFSQNQVNLQVLTTVK
jgi:serine/threonine protein kinase